MRNTITSKEECREFTRRAQALIEVEQGIGEELEGESREAIRTQGGRLFEPSSWINRAERRRLSALMRSRTPRSQRKRRKEVPRV